MFSIKLIIVKYKNIYKFELFSMNFKHFISDLKQIFFVLQFGSIL
jgi:hypothetical protein